MKRFLISIALVATALLTSGCGIFTKTGINRPIIDQEIAPVADMSGKTGIVAHRGYWNCREAGFSQNSIAALRLAQENGFWGSEFDVHLTGDGVVIVNHDNSINGKLIWSTPYSDLKNELLKNGEHRPTLDEYLVQGAKSKTTMLVLEIKKQKDTEHEDILLDKCVAALKKHRLFKPDRVMFISFSHHVCQRIAKEYPEFVNQYLNGDKSPEELQKDGINGIDYQYALLGVKSSYIKRCQELKMSTNVWTVDSENIMKKMIANGVNSITTNEPLMLREVLGENELKISK